jgi:TRAP-type C4-dicarboxylate transport system substrate-binding protein
MSEGGIFDTPFILSGYDNDKITDILINGEFRDLYNAVNEKTGVVCLLLNSGGSMNFTSNRPVYSMADLRGLKIRIQQSESKMLFWSSLGTNPTPLAFSELYMALQNGTVEAQDGLWGVAVTSGAGEVQKYMIPTAHMVQIQDLTMNKDKFYSLPREYQDFLRQICKEVSRWGNTAVFQDDEENYNQLRTKYGLEVCAVSDEFRNAMKEAASASITQTRALVNNDALYASLEKLLNQ